MHRFLVRLIIAGFILVLAGVVVVIVLAAQSRKMSGQEGVAQLAVCTPTPNCVSSQLSDDNNAYAMVEPLPMPDRAEDVGAIGKSIVSQMGGKLIHESGNYLAFTFSSRTFGFIDDFELLIDDSGQTLHVRSSSRVGHNDFGVNLERYEVFKQYWLGEHGLVGNHEANNAPADNG